MPHIDFIMKTGVPTSVSPEERADDIFAQVISGMFEKLWTDSEFGPRDFQIRFGLDEVGYDALRKDSRGGIEGFQDRVCDVLEAVVKDLVIFNGNPITETTRITVICDYAEIADDHEYPCRITVGLRRELDEE